MTRELIEKANDNIRFARDYIRTNSEALECMDLKLHEASYYRWNCDTTVNTDHLFNLMCEVEYDYMVEDFKENGWNWDGRRYIGRTSKFYLHNNYYLNGTRNEINDVIYSVLDNCGWTMDLYPDIEDDHIVENDYLEDAIANVKYIASYEFIKDLKNELAPIIGMYKYIKDFKDNQVETFKWYIKEQEEAEADERERAAEKELTVWLDGVEKIIA